MNIELQIYLLSGVTIAIIIRWIDKYFSRHIFSTDTLLLSRFVTIHPLLSSIIPMLTSMILSIVFHSTNTYYLMYPGLIAAFCIIWPKFYHPEVIPSEIKINKRKLIIYFGWLLITFTVFSMAGGLLGQRLVGFDSTYSARPEANYITWIIIGIALAITKKFIKLR